MRRQRGSQQRRRLNAPRRHDRPTKQPRWRPPHRKNRKAKARAQQRKRPPPPSNVTVLFRDAAANARPPTDTETPHRGRDESLKTIRFGRGCCRKYQLFLSTVMRIERGAMQADNDDGKEMMRMKGGHRAPLHARGAWWWGTRVQSTTPPGAVLNFLAPVDLIIGWWPL